MHTCTISTCAFTTNGKPRFQTTLLVTHRGVTSSGTMCLQEDTVSVEDIIMYINIFVQINKTLRGVSVMVNDLNGSRVITQRSWYIYTY